MAGHFSEPLSPFLVYVLDKSAEGGGPTLGARALRAADYAARRGVNWLTWRVVTHPRIPDGLIEVARSWSLAELLDAHLALDAIEAIEAVERER